MVHSTEPLFGIEGDGLGIGYMNLRDGVSEPAKIIRKHCEELWFRYAPYADRHFISQFTLKMEPRYWEMYLGCILLDHGYEIHSLDHGPDFSFIHEDRNYWIEAVCPDPGDESNPDRVPPIISISEGGGVYDVPVNKILLRLTSALRDKMLVFSQYKEDGVVGADDICIVAISGGRLEHWYTDGSPLPYICRAVFPFGEMYVTFDKETMGVTETGFHYQPEVIKSSGAEVPKTAFFDEEYSQIGGLIYSGKALGMPPKKLGIDLITVHNPTSKNPFTRGIVKCGKEYWKENEELKSHDWNSQEDSN